MDGLSWLPGSLMLSTRLLMVRRPLTPVPWFPGEDRSAQPTTERRPAVPTAQATRQAGATAERSWAFLPQAFNQNMEIRLAGEKKALKKEEII